jgi:hypothetical protein
MTRFEGTAAVFDETLTSRRHRHPDDRMTGWIAKVESAAGGSPFRVLSFQLVVTVFIIALGTDQPQTRSDMDLHPATGTLGTATWVERHRFLGPRNRAIAEEIVGSLPNISSLAQQDRISLVMELEVGFSLLAHWTKSGL